MSEIQYVGSDNDWQKVWDIVQKYIDSPKVAIEEKILIAEARARILSGIAVNDQLQMHDLTIGETYYLSDYKVPGTNRPVQCTLEKINRTRIIVRLIDPTDKWKAGTRVTSYPHHLKKIAHSHV